MQNIQCVSVTYIDMIADDSEVYCFLLACEQERYEK